MWILGIGSFVAALVAAAMAVGLIASPYAVESRIFCAIFFSLSAACVLGAAMDRQTRPKRWAQEKLNWLSK